MLVSSSGDDVSLFFSTTNFSTGKLSPVSEPWITKRSLAWTTRTSPGIMSPAASWTTSPGTRCETAISWAAPPRSTVALTEIIALSFAAALLALASWISRRPTLSAIMSSIIVAARGSPVANDTAASTASRITRGLRTARQTQREDSGALVLGEDVLTVLREARVGLVGGQPLGARLQVGVHPGDVERGALHEGLRHAHRPLLVALREECLGEDAELEPARAHLRRSLPCGPSARGSSVEEELLERALSAGLLQPIGASLAPTCPFGFTDFLEDLWSPEGSPAPFAIWRGVKEGGGAFVDGNRSEAILPGIRRSGNPRAARYFFSS